MNTLAPTTASAWFYMDRNNQQAGPADDKQLEQLIQSGEITPNTLMWTDGLPAWTKANETTWGTVFRKPSTVIRVGNPKKTQATWAYLDASNLPTPPVPESEYAEMVRTQVVHADTLVWSEGMSDWTPLRETPLNKFLQAPLSPPEFQRSDPHRKQSPPSMTQAEARDHVIRALKFGAFSLVVTTLWAVFAEALMWLDVVILAVLLFGLYKMSRTCGILLVTYGTISALFVLLEKGLSNPIGWLVKILFIYAYFMGMKGTFAWHQWKRSR